MQTWSVLHLATLTLLTALAVTGGACTPTRRPPDIAVQEIALESVAPWDSTPMLNVADLDTTTSPCQDFYQYATGGWYRRRSAAMAESVEVVGPDLRRIGVALRQFVVTTPALASTTSDLTTRVLGHFYGSCLADTTGTAKGAVGDTARASYCLRTTENSLELALFQLLLERVWPVDARAQSRTLWTSVTQAATKRLRTSSALSDSTKERLLGVMAVMQLGMGDNGRVPFVPFLDSLAPAWDRISKGIYSNLLLSPNDFVQNLARLQGSADSVPPSVRDALRRLLKQLIDGSGYYNASLGNTPALGVAARALIPPRVDGVVDLGGWYGLVGGGLLGHEVAHPLDFLVYDGRYKQEMAKFAKEQWQGQLELRVHSHFFDDLFGTLIAYDAFEQAMQGRSSQRLEGFTPEQRFFVGAAQSVMGGALTDQSISGSHSQTRWRVYTNGSLSAMPAFARAFGCKAGQPMTGGHVWYKAPWYGVSLAPDQRKARYKEYYADHYNEATYIFLSGYRFRVHHPIVELTQAQRNQLSQISKATHRAQRDALIDSLGSVADNMAGNRRVLRLIAQQFEGLRAQLEFTPEQHERFNQLMREWVQQYLPGD